MDRDEMYRRYRESEEPWRETKRLLKVNRDEDVLPAIVRLRLQVETWRAGFCLLEHRAILR